jgi:hypothetical protein
MAVLSLRAYRGSTILYVGEGRGGVNASPAFFDELERDWVCEQAIELDPFPECFERLYVLRRKPAAK